MVDKVIFRDCFKLVQPSEEEKVLWNDALQDDNKRGLFVYMEATHSAIGNRNNRFYLPSEMAAGANTFLGKRGKTAPIMKHHGGGMFGGDQDPVGKVRSVEYVPTVPQELSDDTHVMDLTDFDLPLKKQVRAAKKFLLNDYAHAEDWPGLGYIKLGAEILDSKAIEQVRDGRFDSVSVSFGTDHAFCSICAADWADPSDGRCEHEPGETYEDEDTGVKERALLIPGKMKFKECSLVAFDADPHTAIEIVSGQMTDNEKTDNLVFSDDTVYDIKSMSWEFTDSEKGADMKKIDVKEGTPIELNDAEEAIFELIKTNRPDAEEAVLADQAKKIAALKEDEEFCADQKDAELDEETHLLYALEDLETSEEEINADEVYSLIEKEFEDMVKEGVLTQEEFEDAKLSTEARKNLKGSTFCGPNKSFPVPDCAHVTAARRLVGKYKGPGNKSSILACVSRKEKTLGCAKDSCGCGTPPKEDTPEEGTIRTLSDEDLRTNFFDVEREMISRQLTVKRECSECGANLKRAEDAEDVFKTTKLELEDKENTLSVLREELRDEFSNYKVVVGDSVSVRNELRKVRADYAAVVAVLSGKETKLEDAHKNLAEAEDFDKAVENIFDNVDLSEIFGKMNDGMVNNNPEGNVEDPTVETPKDNNQEDAALSKTELAIIDRIKEYLEDGDVNHAKQLYDRMVYTGILRDSITWETISAADENADE